MLVVVLKLPHLDSFKSLQTATTLAAWAAACPSLLFLCGKFAQPDESKSFQSAFVSVKKGVTLVIGSWTIAVPQVHQWTPGNHLWACLCPQKAAERLLCISHELQTQTGAEPVLQKGWRAASPHPALPHSSVFVSPALTLDYLKQHKLREAACHSSAKEAGEPISQRHRAACLRYQHTPRFQQMWLVICG